MAHSPFNHNDPDSLTTIVKSVAKLLGDAGQTAVDFTQTVDETEIVSVQRLNTLAGVTPSPRAEVIAFTLSDLKAFVSKRLQAGRKTRSFKWALDGNSIDELSPKSKVRAMKVKLALEQMLVPAAADLTTTHGGFGPRWPPDCRSTPGPTLCFLHSLPP